MRHALGCGWNERRACLVSNSIAKGFPNALHQQLPVEPVAHEDAAIDGDAVPRRRPALVLGLVPLQVHDDPADGGRYEARAPHADQRADLLHLDRIGGHSQLAIDDTGSHDKSMLT